MENSFFFRNEDSIFAHQFNFKHFHSNQIPDILKRIIKFLGKSNNIQSLCDNLQFSDIKLNDPSSILDRRNHGWMDGWMDGWMHIEIHYFLHE